MAKRKTSGQVLSTVERVNEEVLIGVMELANRVGCTHLRVSEVKAVVGGNGNGVKREG
jgi:dihydroneopterin aldolase